MCAQFVLNRAGIFEQRRFIADRKDPDLFGCEPEREVAGVMFDQEADETLVRAEWGAMNAERRFLGVIPIFVNKVETAWLREIDLVGRDGEFATDHAPNLDVDLWSVKGGFVWHLDIVDAGTLENVARHLLGLFPKLRFIDKLLAELCGIVR